MPDVGQYPMEVQGWLHSAQRAREGRDRWRRIGSTLVRLRDAGISYGEIRELTGISKTTAHRLVLTATRGRGTTGSSRSEAGS